MTTLAFVDTETTHLSPELGDAWEIAVIIRRGTNPDRELLWQIRTSLAKADPEALDIGRYHERFAVPDGALAAKMPTSGEGAPVPVTGKDMMLDLMDALDGAIMVGSNPSFDASFLTKLFGSAHVTPAWHYRTIDVATLAAGFLYGQAERMTHRDCDASWYGKVAERIGFPWKSYQASETVGVPRPAGAAAHTALGDARWARDLHDAITIPHGFYTMSDTELAGMASEALHNPHGGPR